MSNEKSKTPRLVCKKCNCLFEPQTLRERVTGTCEKDECYVPFSDDKDVKHYVNDYTKYHFKCLKCSEQIHTNDISERLCPKCRH